MTHPTKRRLLDAGLAMLLKHGYNDLGIQALLAATRTPKGSFYHHFKDKEDFALQIIDQYMEQAHAGLDACLDDKSRPPLERVRRFFAMMQENYRQQDYMGCLLGGLGQELSGVSAVFRLKIDGCFNEIARRLAACLEEARYSRRLAARGGHPRHGRGARGLLGRRGAAKPAARRRHAAHRDARLLFPVARQLRSNASGKPALTYCPIVLGVAPWTATFTRLVVQQQPVAPPPGPERSFTVTCNR